MASTLTAEQKDRIEEQRRKALEIRAKLLENKKTSLPSGPCSYSHKGLNPNYQIPPKPTSSTVTKITPTQTNSPFNKGAPKSFDSSTIKAFSYSKNNDLPKLHRDQKKIDTKTWKVSSDPIAGVCTLISRDRFSVIISFNQKVLELLKTIPGREYDGNSKNWNFPLEQYDCLKEKIAKLSPEVVIGNLPKAILQTFLNNGKMVPKEEYKSIDLSPIDSTLVENLFPFQREGVQFGISKKGRCIIADEMGLGKTIQALGICNYYVDDWPLLIVCPSSMRYQWEEEIRRHLPSVPTYKIYILNNKKDVVENPKVVIVSYDYLAKHKDYLKSLRISCLVLDESHSLKSGKTQRTKAALEMAAKCKRCVLLSGTPALSRPAELYPQIKAVNTHLFKDMIEFGVRYCDGKQDRFGWNFNGSSNLEELKVFLEEKILIRRLKADVLDQLPSKMRQVVVLNKDSIDLDTKSMNAYAKKLNQNSFKGSEKRSTLLSYFAETGKAKIKAICNHVEKLLEQNTKFLLFAHHQEVLNAVTDLLERKETYYIRIDGAVSSEERKAVTDQFQEEDKFRVAVLSIKAANTGLTLTAAQLIVFAELYWNPGELQQAEDRAHRIGQKDSVLVQYLIANGTADDYLWPLVQSKLNVLQKAGLSREDRLSVDATGDQVSNDQPKITNFFKEMFDDNEGVDDADLANLMDELEGVPEKKMKLDF